MRLNEQIDEIEEMTSRQIAVLEKIVALAEIYGDEAVARAIEDGLAFHAFSCEYITNLLEMRKRKLPEAAALSLTRNQDLLELEIEAPDLSAYEVDDEKR